VHRAPTDSQSPVDAYRALADTVVAENSSRLTPLIADAPALPQVSDFEVSALREAQLIVDQTVSTDPVYADAGSAAFDYDRQAKDRLRQSVHQRLNLAPQSGFDIVDAVALGLTLNRNIQISSTDYQGSLGSLEIQRGIFDLSLNAGVSQVRDYSDDTALVQSDTTSLSAGLSKQFRSGIQASVGEDLLGGKYRSDAMAQRGSESNLKFQIVIPLLKGRGRTSAAAEEVSAELSLAAAGLNAAHACATAVKTIAVDYWDFALASQRLDLAIEAECRSQKILEDTRIMVAHDAKPFSLISTLEADLATKRAERYAREQDLFRSRSQLALDLGIPVKNAPLLPLASRAFPEPPPIGVERLLAHQDRLFEMAEDKRKDLEASRRQLESAEVMENKARIDLWPNLNLTVGRNFHGWDKGGNRWADMTDAFGSADDGYVYGLSFTVPLENHAARGQLRIQSAQTERSRLTYENAVEQIRNDVAVAINTLVQACAQLTQNRLAETMYRRAVDNEIERFRLGKSTILDVMDAQDRLNGALSSVVAAQATVAKSIVDLRYQSGLLIDADEGGSQRLPLEHLVTLPNEVFQSQAAPPLSPRKGGESREGTARNEDKATRSVTVAP